MTTSLLALFVTCAQVNIWGTSELYVTGFQVTAIEYSRVDCVKYINFKGSVKVSHLLLDDETDAFFRELETWPCPRGYEISSCGISRGFPVMTWHVKFREKEKINKPPLRKRPR